MKGNQYRVSLPGMEIYSDGRTSWNYDKSANEVTVSGVDAFSWCHDTSKTVYQFLR